MHTLTPEADARTNASVRRRTRAIAVAGGAAAALVVWAIGRYLIGVEMRAPMFGASEPSDIGVAPVLVTAVMWSLVGWGLLALLERFAARARTIWTWLAIAGTVLSFSTPLLTPDISPGTRAVLSVMHLSVAVVVIPVLRRTSWRA